MFSNEYRGHGKRSGWQHSERRKRGSAGAAPDVLAAAAGQHFQWSRQTSTPGR